MANLRGKCLKWAKEELDKEHRTLADLGNGLVRRKAQHKPIEGFISLKA